MAVRRHADILDEGRADVHVSSVADSSAVVTGRSVAQAREGHDGGEEFDWNEQRGRGTRPAPGRWEMGRRIVTILLVAVFAGGLWPGAVTGQAKTAMTFWRWRGADKAFYEGML